MMHLYLRKGAHSRPFFLYAQVISLACLLVAVVLFAYSAVRLNGYVWDDWEIVNRSLAAKGDEAVETIFGPVLPGAPYFRPVVLSTFFAEIQWGGANPARSHLISLAIHIANVLLLYTILLCLARQMQGSLRPVTVSWIAVGALLYALHPALIESVSWASARFDLLSTNLALLYILIGLSLSGPLRLPLLIIVFLAAMMCKEVVIGLPLIFPLMSAFVRRQDHDDGNFLLRRGGEGLLICLAGAFIYFYAKGHYIDQAIFTDQYVAEIWSGWKRFALVGETLLMYLALIFFPFTSIGPHHPIPWQHMAGVRPLFLSGFVVVSCAALMVLVVRRRALMPAGVLIAIAPVMNILPLSVAGSIVQDRYLTLPLAIMIVMGMIAAMKSQIWDRWSRSAVLMAVVVGVFFAFFMNVKVTVPLWRSDLTLWAWAAQKHVSEPYVRKNYVSSLIEYGLLDKAENVLSNGASASGERDLDLQEAKLRAQLHLKRGEWMQVIDVLDGVDTQTEIFWEKVRRAGGDPTQMWLPTDSPVANSDEIKVFMLRSEAWLAMGRYSDGLREAEKALFINRRNNMARTLAAFAYYGLGDTDRADREYRSSIAGMLPEQRALVERAKADLLKRLSQ